MFEPSTHPFAFKGVEGVLGPDLGSVVNSVGGMGTRDPWWLGNVEGLQESCWKGSVKSAVGMLGRAQRISRHCPQVKGPG